MVGSTAHAQSSDSDCHINRPQWVDLHFTENRELLQYQLCRSSLVANEGKVGIMAPLCFQRYYGRAVSHCDKFRLCQDDFDKSTTPEGNAQSFWKLTHPGNGVLTFVISSWSRFYRQILSVKCIVGASKTWINVPGILHCPRSILKFTSFRMSDELKPGESYLTCR